MSTAVVAVCLGGECREGPLSHAHWGNSSERDRQKSLLLPTHSQANRAAACAERSPQGLDECKRRGRSSEDLERTEEEQGGGRVGEGR